jgi:hypothetical protein
MAAKIMLFPPNAVFAKIPKLTEINSYSQFG